MDFGKIIFLFNCKTVLNTLGRISSWVFFTLLTLELEVVSEELAEVRAFFGEAVNIQ